MGHRSGSPETLWPFFLPLTPFFWDVNVRVTDVAAWRLASVEVAAKTLHTQLNETSLICKGLISDFDPVYSPGRKRKKYATIIM